MTRDYIYKLLDEREMWYEVTKHKVLSSMKESMEIDMPYPEYDGKNLFVRDNKKRHYYLITVRGDKRVDLKKFRDTYNTKSLSFASENDLMDIMGLIPGSVTPFGLLNDKDLKVEFYLDKEFLEGDKLIGVHPNEITETMWMKTEDLLELIREHGTVVNIIDIEE